MEGGVPRSVGARHYSKLVRQADGYYPKFAAFLVTISARAKQGAAEKKNCGGRGDLNPRRSGDITRTALPFLTYNSGFMVSLFVHNFFSNMVKSSIVPLGLS